LQRVRETPRPICRRRRPCIRTPARLRRALTARWLRPAPRWRQAAVFRQRVHS
jgi:hypothetical protein